jgi:transcriptional regulator with XRE-family HTH domain
MPRKRQQNVDGLSPVQIGQRVKARRLHLKLSQEKLAAKLSISFQQVQKYEKGSNSMNVTMAQAMAAALNVPMNYFFEDNGKASQPEFHMLAQPGAIELLTAYTKIKSRKLQQHLIKAALLMTGMY